MSRKLSVIIPVYNVEAYVGRTLESVFATDASADDFEVIVVNDGTKDGSMEVVRRYADRPNITIIEQENQGLSAARMNGLALAKGEYVWFVDSDDWLVENGVGRVLELLEERPEVDVLLFPYLNVYADPSENHLSYCLDEDKVMSGREVIRDSGLPLYSVVRFVLRRSLMDSEYLYFPLGLLHEDLYFGPVLFYLAKKVLLLRDYVYVRIHREGSIMSTRSIRSSYDVVRIHRMLMRFKEKAVDPADWTWFQSYCLDQLMYSYRMWADSYDERGFWLFACTNGFYVWRQWDKVYPSSPLHKKAGRLFYFLLPRVRTRLLG